jgi:hypothetical protein
MAFVNVLSTLCLFAASAAVFAADAPASSHKDYFEHYEGTATCLQCHRAEAETFFHSQHYQWMGETPNLVNAGGKKLGKMNTMNDFCTNPAASWIGPSIGKDDKILGKGCSQCHAGLGKLPSPALSEEQLLNIDCLICHASGYRRDLYSDKGAWSWKPILWQNQEGLDSVSKRISLPNKEMCLRCHAGAGGGLNYKRGDIEYALAKADKGLDIHLGGGMECITCHKGRDHRVLGRGSDLSATDTPGVRLTCERDGCHKAAPHRAAVLNTHTARVNCTACHIPDFALVEPTDMKRDWSRMHYDEEKGKYEGTLTMQSHVTPFFAWWNGNSSIQELGTPVRKKDGIIQMMMPEGSRADSASRIYAFKKHEAVLPVEKGTDMLIPIKVGLAFSTGDIDAAVKAGGMGFYGREIKAYTWAPSVRLMGVFHEIPPAEKALTCTDCHGKKGRMDFKALGYDQDPLVKALTAP